MRKLQFRATVPPGGYTWRVPETGDELVAGDLAQLVNQARVIYARNKFEPPADLPARIEHDICLQIPESCCVGTHEPGDVKRRMVNARAVREATALKTIRLKWDLNRFLVPPVEAERRAAICAACPLNFQGFCTTCNGLKNFVVEAIGGRTTTMDAKLGVCSVCSCLIKAKVHISAEALKAARKSPEEGEYPSNCWMKEIVE